MYIVSYNCVHSLPLQFCFRGQAKQMYQIITHRDFLHIRLIQYYTAFMKKVPKFIKPYTKYYSKTSLCACLKKS